MVFHFDLSARVAIVVHENKILGKNQPLSLEQPQILRASEQILQWF